MLRPAPGSCRDGPPPAGVHNTPVSLPDRLGRLRRVRRIGAGGFATVWLYHDDELDSPVAVKALADNWAQRTDVRDRFLEEARMLRRADSDHVVRIYDIGEVEQTPYFVMSYADRGTLATLTDAGPVSPARTLDLIVQAATGVAVLHQRGIIHRDIKPHNLLLATNDDGSDRVLVADLGVAKAMAHASGLTQVVGTPAYMAPEQATGRGVDRRADVHALGAVAYHLLTGQQARTGGVADLVTPFLPAPPSSIRPELAAYDAVLLRALEPDPDDRWPDARSFAAAFAAAADRDSGAAVQLSDHTVAMRRQRLPRRPGRPLAYAAVAAALVVLLACGAAGYALWPSGATRSAGTTTTQTTTPTKSVSIAPDVSYPVLRVLQLTEKHRLVSPNGDTWTYEVPRGWVADSALTGAPLPAAAIDTQQAISWHPQHPPRVGGYSLRLDALNGTQFPQDMRQRLLNELQSSDHVHELTPFANRPNNGLWFTFVDDLGHVRYNFFRWLSLPAGEAGLRAAVVGRKVDLAGLESLLDAITGSVIWTPATHKP